VTNLLDAEIVFIKLTKYNIATHNSLLTCLSSWLVLSFLYTILPSNYWNVKVFSLQPIVNYGLLKRLLELTKYMKKLLGFLWTMREAWIQLQHMFNLRANILERVWTIISIGAIAHTTHTNHDSRCIFLFQFNYHDYFNALKYIHVVSLAISLNLMQ